MPARSETGTAPGLADRLAALIAGGADVSRSWVEGAEHLIQAAAAHGVVSLVADAAYRTGARPGATGFDPAARDRLQSEARRNLTADLVREHALRALVERLHEAGVPALLMKGADLAYSVYPRADLRARLDTDLLVHPSSRVPAATVLGAMGYDPVPQSGGDLLMYQESYRLGRGGMDVHVVDLHWRVSNSQRFAGVLTFDEMWAASEPRPRLALHARGLDAVHALLLACVHRIAHHFDTSRLVWTYDVHLLATRLPAARWTDFLALATSRLVDGPCLRSLETAVRLFGTPVPGHVLAGLSQRGRAEADADPFLSPGARHASRVWSEVRHIESWMDRWRLMRQHAFPPAAYMRDVYAPASTAPLWLLYLLRILRGSRRWLSRT